MGGHINIGIVYSDEDIYKLNDDKQLIINYFSLFSNRIVVNYPVDDTFQKWEEKRFEGQSGLIQAFEILNSQNMALGKMFCKIHNKDCYILVSIRKCKDKFKGILIEIAESDLLKEDYSREDLDDIENKILVKLIEIWKVTNFSYAFCDSDADIEYQLSEIEDNKGSEYSMVLLKDNLNDLVICLNSWCIDGITGRKIK